MVVDDNVFRQLPENGFTADRIPTSVRADKMGCDAGWAGGAAAADDGEGENEDKLHVGGVMDLGNQERPEVEQL